MPAVRQMAAVATDLSCRLVGRRNVFRAARFVLLRARLDYRNEMTTNGELSLQRWMLGMSRAGEQIQVADVGANVGRWSGSMLAAASEAGREADLHLHAFEPESQAFARLMKAVGSGRASLHRVALSDRQGASLLHVIAPAAGTNSLLPVPGAEGAAHETVPTITLDSYAAQAGLDRLALVKIDAEGHDLAILRGARGLLAEHRISVVQFEYNFRWIYARSFLKDAFELLLDLEYRLGKLTPRGVEFYPCWHADLETFVEGNYVACVPHAAGLIPSIRR